MTGLLLPGVRGPWPRKNAERNVNVVTLTLFHPGVGADLAHPAHTRIPVENRWVEILIIFVYS